jgi:cytochrome b
VTAGTTTLPESDPQAPPAQPGDKHSGSVTAWDAPTRIFHWLLVILVAASWGTYEYSEALDDPVLKWHRWSGLLILTLLVWRLLWGVFGSSTARFSNFIPTPRGLVAYASAIRNGREPKYLGHNPLGAMMIAALLALLLTQAVLGLFTVEHNDLTAGPLYRYLSEAGRKAATSWHRYLFEEVTLWFIGIHILANVAYAVFRREPLIKAMISGRKPASDYADARALGSVPRPMLRAGLLLALSAVIVFGGIWAAGGKFLQMRLW